MKIKTILTALCLSLLLACSHHDDPSPAEGPTVQLRIAIATGDAPSATRSPGDPGTTQVLSHPTLVYVFFVNQENKVTHLMDMDDNILVNPLALDTPVEMDYQGSLATQGDRVYNYLSTEVKLPAGSTSGRFYAVAATKRLKKNGTDLAFLTPTTEDDLLSMMAFDCNGATDADVQPDDLKDIYSTPWNYDHFRTNDDNTVVGLMLYHVAARVDVQWNVAKAMQSSHRVSAVTATGLKREACLAFKPLDNDPDTPGGSLALKGADEVGSQWYGRVSFYTPVSTSGGYLTLPLSMTDGESSYTTTLKLDMSTADPVFVPWIRVNLNLTKDDDFANKTLILNQSLD